MSALEFGVPLAEQLNRLGQSLNLPPGRVWLAAFQAFLARYHQQDDPRVALCLGMTADENHAGVEVLWANVTAHLTAEGTLAEVARQMEERPLRLLPTEERPRWAFRFLPTPMVASFSAAAHGLGVELFLELAEGGQTAHWHFDAQRVLPDDVARLHASLQCFLQALLREPGQPCARLPLLSEAEQRHLVVELNRTESDYARTATLPSLFEAHAEQQPEVIAALFEGQTLTYGDLNRRANRVAHALRARGVEPGKIVGLFLERSLDLLVAQLAVFKAGGAYVAFDPQYPREMLARQFHGVELASLITHTSLAAHLPPGHGHALLLDAEGWHRGEPDTNPAPLATANDVALILFTSGSTGAPKGVQHTHRNLAARFHAQEAVTQPAPTDRMGQTSPLSSIDAMDELLGPLMRGARVVIIPYAVVTDPHRLAEALEQEAVTHLLLVPSLLKVLLAALERQPQTLSALRVVMIGGEPLTAALARQFYQHFPTARLVNFYGLTEGDALAHDVPPDAPESGAPPIGRPVPNTKVYLLDHYLNPVPIGMVGEIHVAGDGLMAGYLNRPDLNEQKWVGNPFAASNEAAYARLFKTGDLGRYRPNGDIEYVGRRDRMVKIRGFRVELGEVEAALQQHPAVKECVVAAKATADAPQKQRLIGYVVLRPDHHATAHDLRKYLGERLPDYAVPAIVLPIERVPLSPNGKVDLAALPNPEEIVLAARPTFVAPRDPLELQLSHTWEEVLKVRPVGVTDNFFDLGGDSLAAVELALNVEQAFHYNLPISALLHAPTVSDLAELLRAGNSHTAPRWSSLVPIQTQGHLPPLFCVHADGGILFYYAFAQKMGREQPVYGIQARGLLGQTEELHTRLEDIAAQYVAEVRTVQPHGPYHFCAFSLGGAFIFEMAQQLRAAGESVAFLGMLDAYGPHYPRRLPGKSVVHYKMSVHWNTLRLHDFAGRVAYLQRRFRQRSEIIFANLAGPLYNRLRLPLPQALRYNYIRRILNRAADAYRPQRYPGPLTVFRATIQPEGIEADTSLGWREYADGEITVYDTPGTHNSILKEPHLSGLIAQLESHLGALRA